MIALLAVSYVQRRWSLELRTPLNAAGAILMDLVALCPKRYVLMHSNTALPL